jgi:phosphopentomutase
VGEQVIAQNLGLRDTFADMGQTLAQHLNVAPLQAGVACKLN